MPPNFEPKGTGVNKLQYWATNDCKYYFSFNFKSLNLVFEEWKELPAVTP